MTSMAAQQGTRSALEAAVEELRAQVGGEVLEPSDPGQQDVRGVFNAMHPSRPGGDGESARARLT